MIRMVQVSRFVALLAIVILPLSGCIGGSGKEPGNLWERRINVVATIGMIGDVVSAIGGDRVKVTTLMGAGVDPHLYKASEGDVVTLEKADLIFYNGLHLEAKLGEILEKMVDRTQTVAVTTKIPATALLTPPEFDGNPDPHVWFDVALWRLTAEQIRDTLISLDTPHQAVYEAQAATYLDQLDALNAYVKAQSETIPPAQRVLITAHDAFGYFGKAYGFEVRGLQGVSTASETGTADVQSLADFIAERQIRAVFVESSVPRRTIEALQAAVRARGFEVTIGGELFSDAMGDPGTVEGTYLGMVRHNIDTIVAALT